MKKVMTESYNKFPYHQSAERGAKRHLFSITRPIVYNAGVHDRNG
jgi:hypothetical protein